MIAFIIHLPRSRPDHYASSDNECVHFFNSRDTILIIWERSAIFLDRTSETRIGYIDNPAMNSQ